MHFRPLVGLTIATLVAEVVLINLGLWQLRRLEWKEGLIAKTEQRLAAPPIALSLALDQARRGADVEYFPVETTGRYRHDRELFLYGVFDATPGYFVYTPFERTRGEPVLVNRGFVPEELKPQSARLDGLPEGERRLVGVLRTPERLSGLADRFRPQNDPDANLWFRRDPAAMAAATGISAPAVTIDSSGEENPGAWPRGGVTRTAFRNNHFGYALTWFGLAAALAGVYAAYHVSAGRLRLGRAGD